MSTDSLASAYELTKFSPEYEMDNVNKPYVILGKSAKESPYGNKVVDNVNNIMEFAVGKQAPDLEGKDTLGVVYKLSDYRGKYVLLDFTSSSCAPCGIEAPVLKRVYNECDDRVEIISLSIDKERAAWIKGIYRDSMYGQIYLIRAVSAEKQPRNTR